MKLFPSPSLVVLALLALGASIVLFMKRRGQNPRIRAALLRRGALALVLLGVALRPTVGSTTTTTYASGVDVVIMIDRTTSMAAEDYDGTQTRLAGVRADLTRLIESLAGSRFAIVIFDNDARVALPFTTDAAAAISLVDAVGWREAKYGTGSDIGIGLKTARAVLASSQQDHPKVGRYLIYAGDGEQTAKTPPSSFTPLKPLLDGGIVLGYGTTKGGVMHTVEGGSNFVTRNGKQVRSVINEANLRNIASQAGISYAHRTAPGELKLPVRNRIRVPIKHREPSGFELYWIIAVVGLAVLASELWVDIAALRRLRELR